MNDSGDAPVERTLRLDCPCGERIVGVGEDDLVEKAYAHLRERHPELADEYTPDNILMMSF